MLDIGAFICTRINWKPMDKKQKENIHDRLDKLILDKTNQNTALEKLLKKLNPEMDKANKKGNINNTPKKN